MTTTVPTTPPATPTGVPTGAVKRGPRSWPVLLLALPAFVAIWSGWVGLGDLTGFGVVHPLPGIWDAARINTAITLPIGVETYAAYALHVWLTPGLTGTGAARFAKWSALGSLVLGGCGQVAYHLMAAAGIVAAPWQITALVACLPVAVLGMGAALAHLVANTVPTPNRVDQGQELAELAADRESVPAESQHAAEPPEPVTDNVSPTTPPAPKARPARSTGKPSTAATITRLRRLHPDWTHARIAEKAGVTERTVSRHLNASKPPAAAPSAPVERADVDHVDQGDAAARNDHVDQGDQGDGADAVDRAA